MAITISGTTGIAGVDGSAGTPAVQGTDTNTGVFYPAADTVGVSTGGSERVRVDSSGNVGIGTSSPTTYGKLAVTGTTALGVDQTDYINALGGGGTARVEAVGGNTNINLALSTKGTGAFYIWRGGYGGTNTLLIDGSSNLQFNSGYGSVATAYGCRAWVNFNGTGTVAIRASGNVTSITDNGVGDYTVNFTNAMPDGNYSVVTCNQSIGGPNKGFTAQYELANPATGSCRVVCFSNGATSATADPTYFFASFFR